MALAAGDIVDGKYRVVRQIGEGGMGAVFEGVNERIQRRVAIKTLHAGLASNDQAVARFEREAQAAGTIGNDHILEILDLGALSDGDRYMVMEFLDGEPLSRRIQSFGRLLPRQAVPIIRQVLAGLAAAHAVGIVHRDLKPDNIFILQQKAGVADFVKIIDFGISKFQPLSGDGMRMTRTGMVMGTPFYMSPEQANGSRDADARADLYAMGVILYECVTGAVPFQATTFNQLLFKIVLEEPVHPATLVPDLDGNFAAIILKAMARKPEDRYQTCAEFTQALDQWMGVGAGPAIVQPSPVVSAYAAAPTPAFGANAPAAMGPSTANSWAQSQPPLTVPAPRSRAGLVVGLALGGLLLVGGAVAVYALRTQGADIAAADSTQPVAPAPAAPVQVEPSVAPEVAPPSVAPAAAPSAQPQAPERAPAAERKPQAETKRTEAKPAAAPKATATAAFPPVNPAPAPAKPAREDFGY